MMKLRMVLTGLVLLLGLSSSAALAAITFSGGNYWISGWSQHTPKLVAVNSYAINSITSVYPTSAISLGDTIEPGVDGNGDSIYEALLAHTSDGDAYHAQIRAGTVREIRWGIRVNIDAPDASGNGTMHMLMPGMHRHAIKVADDGFSSGFQISYTVDSDNKISFTSPWGSTMKGIFTSDHEALVFSETGDGFGLNYGVKVDAGGTTLPNADYAFNEYRLDIHRDDTVNTDGENGNEDLTAYFQNSIAWLDLVSSSGNYTFSSIRATLSIVDPDTSSASLSTGQNDDKKTGTKGSLIGSLTDGAGPVGPFADGAGPVGPYADSWMAISDSGEFGMMTSAADYDTRFSDSSVGGTNSSYADQYRHNQSYTSVIKLASSGTHTSTTMTGTYQLTGYWDGFNSSSANGDSGISTGSVVLSSGGTGTFSFTDTNNIDVTSSSSGSINWSIKAICIGVDGTTTPPTRLAYTPTTNCATNGGKVVDTIEISDPGTSAVMANMLISSSGKFMTYLDMKGLNSTTAYNRSLGTAVKLP